MKIFGSRKYRKVEGRVDSSPFVIFHPEIGVVPVGVQAINTSSKIENGIEILPLLKEINIEGYAPNGFKKYWAIIEYSTLYLIPRWS